MNPFDTPQKFRNLILKDVRLNFQPDQLTGKSFICFSLTKFCPVGCAFCFFKSKSPTGIKTIHDTLGTKGVEKFIKFANNSNLGYLLVSGGGEPFVEFDGLLKIVEEIKSDKIVIVTSGYWAKRTESAEKLLDKLFEAAKKRKTKSEIVVRLSVDEEHNKDSLFGLDTALNVIELFNNKYLNNGLINVQIHSIIGDKKIEELKNYFKNQISEVKIKDLASDGITADKITPREEILKFKTGLNLRIGYGKIFYSDVKVDLSDEKVIQRNITVFDDDMILSEENNPSTVSNLKDKNKGLDFWVNYNGNVTTWGNQVTDNLFNIYIDTYDDLVRGSFSDPLLVSYIEKGNNYRDKIVSEVNSRAVLRTKAINIRDYTGAILFEEEKIRLYYSIRAIQDFIDDKKIDHEELKKWPSEIVKLVTLEHSELIRLYKESKHSIVDQYIQRGYHKELWHCLLEQIALGHFDLNPEQIQQALNYYNKHNIGNEINSVTEALNKSDIHAYQENITSIKNDVIKSGEFCC